MGPKKQPASVETAEANPNCAPVPGSITSNWETILSAGMKAADAYADLVAASDALADMMPYMPYDREYVLRRVMHQKPEDRRNSKRIVEWLKDNREKIEADLKAWNDELREENERAALLEKLKLTDEQKALLGITRRDNVG